MTQFLIGSFKNYAATSTGFGTTLSVPLFNFFFIATSPERDVAFNVIKVEIKIIATACLQALH